MLQIKQRNKNERTGSIHRMQMVRWRRKGVGRSGAHVRDAGARGIQAGTGTHLPAEEDGTERQTKG